MSRRPPTVTYQNPQCLISAKLPLCICPHGSPRNDAGACTKSPKAGIIVNKVQGPNLNLIMVSRSLSGLEVAQAQTRAAPVLQTEILRSFDTNLCLSREGPMTTCMLPGCGSWWAKRSDDLSTSKNLRASCGKQLLNAPCAVTGRSLEPTSAELDLPPRMMLPPCTSRRSNSVREPVTSSGTPAHVDHPRRTAALCMGNAPTAFVSNIMHAGSARQPAGTVYGWLISGARLLHTVCSEVTTLTRI